MPAGADPGRPGLRVVTAEAPAKLNLGLAVLGRRPDGFHDIRTVFQAVDWFDRVVVHRTERPGIELEVVGDDRVPPGPENLIHRAAAALIQLYRPPGGVAIRLEKGIPPGSGLGGGSSDAAATLLALASLWGLGAGPGTLRSVAGTLGSDVPFFLLGGTARGEGRGERLTPESWTPPWAWILAVPTFGISTGAAYLKAHKGLTESGQRPRMPGTALLHRDYAAFARNLVNDLEPGVLELEPRLAAMRRAMLEAGAPLVAMTGSGSTLFSVVPERSAEEVTTADGGAAPPPNWTPWERGATWAGLSAAIPHLAHLRVCRSISTGARVVGEAG